MDPAPLIDRIDRREAVVGVVGLGYVGLPLVLEFCSAGFKVIGFDTDVQKTQDLNSGRSYIEHIPAETIAKPIGEGRLEATADFARVDEVDTLLICVPTPLTGNREPDLSFVRDTGQRIAPYLRRGHLVILESTTYPGTTDEVLRIELECGELRAGKDFFLAYSPEREDPGNPEFSTGTVPKVIGGYDVASTDAADALYRSIVKQTVRVSSMRTAEAVKLLENIFRSVNIALVNELKTIYTEMDIDIWEVIEAAKTKPFGYMPFYPGPGLGGHCIPIDPFYLAWKAREYGITTRFIELAGEINTAMPHYVIARLMEFLNEQGKTMKDSRILVLGVAYKPDIGDARESPGITLIAEMQKRGALVDYNDPHVPRLPKQRQFDLGLESVELTEDGLAAYDCVLIATAHSSYDYSFIVRNATLVVDTRNATSDVTEHREKIRRA